MLFNTKHAFCGVVNKHYTIEKFEIYNYCMYI